MKFTCQTKRTPPRPQPQSFMSIMTRITALANCVFSFSSLIIEKLKDLKLMFQIFFDSKMWKQIRPSTRQRFLPPANSPEKQKTKNLKILFKNISTLPTKITESHRLVRFLSRKSKNYFSGFRSLIISRKVVIDFRIGFEDNKNICTIWGGPLKYDLWYTLKH